MKARLIITLLLVFILTACSYQHGFARIHTFENDIVDWSCISDALESESLDKLIYKTSSFELGVDYGVIPNGLAAFSYAVVRDKEANTQYCQKT